MCAAPTRTYKNAKEKGLFFVLNESGFKDLGKEEKSAVVAERITWKEIEEYVEKASYAKDFWDSPFSIGTLCAIITVITG